MLATVSGKEVTGYLLMVLGFIVFTVGFVAAARKLLHEQVQIAKGAGSPEEAIPIPPGVWPVLGALVKKGGAGTLMGLGIGIFIAGAALEGWVTFSK